MNSHNGGVFYDDIKDHIILKIQQSRIITLISSRLDKHSQICIIKRKIEDQKRNVTVFSGIP